MLQGDVVDQLLNDDRLADAGAAKEADLAALEEWLDQVDDLHARLEHFFMRRLLIERRSRTVNGHVDLCVDRAKLVDRLSDHVEHATKRLVSHGNGNRAALIDGIHASHHAFGGLHGDAAHAAFAQMLLHFKNHVNWVRHREAVAHNAQRLVNRRYLCFFKLNVHRRSGDFNDPANILCHKILSLYSAAAPLTISISSLVIAAWRA